MIFSAAALAQQGALRPGDPDPYAARPGAPNPYATRAGDPNPYATRAGDPNPYATRAGDPNPYATRAGDANTLPAQDTRSGDRHRTHRERRARAAQDPNSEYLQHGTGAHRR